MNKPLSRTRHLTAILTVAVTSFAGLGYAQAAFQVVHGSSCIPTAAARNLVDYNWFGVFNTNGSNQATVVCPVHGEFTTTFTGATFTDITISVYDRHATADISCKVQVVNTIGTDLITPIIRSTSGSSPGAKSLTASFPAGITTAFPVVVTCTLPAKVGDFNIVSGIQVRTTLP